jgi:hypothetical protein
MNYEMMREKAMRIKDERLKLLMKLFNSGEVKIATDSAGFVFIKNGDTYPIEIYEDGHWDGSLTQALAHTKEEKV